MRFLDFIFFQIEARSAEVNLGKASPPRTSPFAVFLSLFETPGPRSCKACIEWLSNFNIFERLYFTKDAQYSYKSFKPLTNSYVDQFWSREFFTHCN